MPLITLKVIFCVVLQCGRIFNWLIIKYIKGESMKKIIVWTFTAVSCLTAVTAIAADVSLSGFGTVGYTVSDQDFNYQRYVNKHGTFYRDSVMGAQVDVKLNNEFSLTVQGKIAPSMSNDTGVDPTLSWAFLSWRPTNDWLVRAGRLRIPLYLKSETVDVGTTYDFARLPAEVYTTSQTNDADGIIVSKTWNTESNEWVLDGFFGTAKTDYRYFLREGMPSLGMPAGATFGTSRMTGGGLALNLHRGDDIYRACVFKANLRSTDGVSVPETYPFVDVMPGVGYYQVSNQLPGSGVPSTNEIHAMAYSLGADVGVGFDFRVTGEYVLRKISNTDISSSSQSAYLAVLRPIEAWTPYASVAWIKSLDGTLNLYNKANNSSVPNAIPNAALINASQRAGADAIAAYDQFTLAIGTSYRVSPTSKVKAEWARTQTGDVSSFVDAPSGGETGHKVINVFSLSYNFVF